MSDCKNGLFNCITPLPMDASGKMSDYEFLCWIQTNMRNLIQEVGEMEAAWKALQEWVTNYFNNLDVQQEINNKIDEMVQSGEMDEIINENLFSSLDERIASNKQDIDNLSNSAITKTSTDYVGMGQLTQEVKEALTGGSTAVVGTNAVGTNNIMNQAVTIDKLANDAIILNLTINETSRVDLNSIAGTITFSTTSATGFIFSYGSVLISTDAPVVLNFDGSASKFIMYNPQTNVFSLEDSTSDELTLVGFINNRWELGIDSKIRVFYNGYLRGTPIHINASLSNVVAINSSTGTVSFTNEAGNFIITYDSRYISVNASTISLVSGTNSLFYNSDSNVFSTSGDCYIGNIWYNEGKIFTQLIDDVTITYDGNNMVQASNGVGCANNTCVVFDYVNQTITFPAGFNITINNQKYTIANEQVIDLDVQNSWGYIVFSPYTATFRIASSGNVLMYETIVGQTFGLRNVGTFYYSQYRMITQGDVTNYNVCPSVALFGDSIPAGVGAPIPLSHILAIRGRVTVLNYAIGGTCYSVTRDEGMSTWIGQGTTDRAIKGGMPTINAFPERINSLLPTLTSEVIAIFGGTNDFGLNVPIDTFKTNVNLAIQYIYSAGKIPLIFSPVARSDRTTNTLNLTVLDYVNALEECCYNHNVKFVDLYHTTGLYPFIAQNKTKYYNDDVHPNSDGHLLLAAKFQEAIYDLRVIIGSL